jgi:hypothetical protein
MRLGHLLDILQINTGGDERLPYKEKTLADVGATLVVARRD